MNVYVFKSTAASSPKPITTCCSVLPPEIVMHDDVYISGRSENNINALCMTISGGRTKQLNKFCRVTGFTSVFLSFTVVELIRFFHGALQLLL